MAQHDGDIANQTFPNTRADINNALAAARTFNSGATEPSSTAAYMPWADTAANLMKQRNAGDSGWVVRGTLDESFVLARSSNTILAGSDRGKAIIATSTFTQTLTAAATLGDGWHIWYRNDGTGVITIDPNSSEQIDGAATLILYPGQSCHVVCNGTGFYTVGKTSDSVVFLGSLAASSSASLDFTGNIGASFERYRLDLISIRPASDDIGMSLRVGNSGGFKSGASDYSYGLTMRSVASGTPVETVSTGTSGIVLASGGTGLNPGNGSAENVDGHVYFTNPEDNTAPHKIWWDLVFTNANGNASKASGYGCYTGATSGAIVMDRIQILFNSGNITSGSIKLYGMRTT